MSVTLLQIYQIREAIEPAIASLISTLEPDINVYPEFSASEKQTTTVANVEQPWVEVEFDPGKFGDHRETVTGQFRRDYMPGAMLSIRVRSNRGPMENDSDSKTVRLAQAGAHQRVRGNILTLVFDKLTLSLHQIITATLQSQPQGMIEGEAQDTTQLQYLCHACIRPSAWAQAISPESLFTPSGDMLFTPDSDLLFV